MANKKKEETAIFNDDDIFGDLGEELPKDIPLKAEPKEETKEELQARIDALQLELKEKTETIEKIETVKEGPTMAKKGGIYQVMRETTYKGSTMQLGAIHKLEEPNVTNKWLKKIGEFAIDEGFHEDLNGKVKSVVMEDDVKKSGYR